MLLKKSIFGLALVLIAVAVAYPAGAIPMNEVKNAATNANLATYQSFSEIATAILKALLAISFIISVIFVVISGYRFVASQGNEEKVEQAKKNLFWAGIGMAVIVLSWIVMTIVIEAVKSGNVGTM